MTTLMHWNGWGGLHSEFWEHFIFWPLRPSGGCLPHAVVGVPHRGPRPLDGHKSSIQAKFAPRACQVRPTSAIPKHWLGSESPFKHLCTYCPKATQQSPAARPAVAWLRCCSKVGATQHQELLTKGFHGYPRSIARRSPRRKRVWDDCFTSSSSISRSTECVRCLDQRTMHQGC